MPRIAGSCSASVILARPATLVRRSLEQYRGFLREIVDLSPFALAPLYPLPSVDSGKLNAPSLQTSAKSHSQDEQRDGWEKRPHLVILMLDVILTGNAYLPG